MANEFDEFNYDGDDPELDENGLPIDPDDEQQYGDVQSQIESYDMDENNDLDNSQEDGLESEDEEDDEKTAQDKLEDLKLSSKLAKNEAKMKLLKTQVTNMVTAPTPLVLTPTQSASLKEAEELVKNPSCNMLHPARTRTLKNTIKEIKTRVFYLRITYWIDKIKPILPYVAIAIGVIVLIIILLMIILSIVAAVAGEYEERTGADGLANNQYIVSECFYGLRTAYIDEEILSDQLQLSYKQYSVEILDKLDDNGDITLNITLPSEFDNSTSIDNNLVSMSLALGNIVANNNPSYSGVNFSQLYPNIPYFGLTPTQSQIFNEFLAQYLVDNEVIEVSGGVNIPTRITSITSDPSMEYMFNICQKVMIQDLIATEYGIEELEVANYVGSIYMANKNISLKNMSFVINNASEDKTTSVKLVSSTYNGEYSEQIISSITTPNDQSDGDVTLIEDLPASLSVEAFTCIDSSNTGKFAEGLTLFDAIKIIGNESYFAQITDENSVIVYTWKPNCSALFWEFNSVDKFIYGEFDVEITAN